MSTTTTPACFRIILPLFLVLLLPACGTRPIEYNGTCAQQTQQFMDYIHALVTDELTPVIEEGFHAALPEDVIAQIQKLDTKVSQLDIPECNPRTQAVKDALRLYMLEARNYFSTVAGRAVYGEGPVQGQLSRMFEAGSAFEKVFADVRK